MQKPRVFITRNMHPDALDLIGQSTDMDLWPEDAPPDPAQMREKLADAEGVLTNIMDRIDGPALNAGPRLRVVSQLAAGVDNIDIPECTRRGILVGSTPGVLSKAVADHGFALLLASARRVVETDKWLRAGNWKLAFHPNYWIGAEVQGSTLGIVGLGQIGLEMARRGQGFDMKIVYHARNRRPDLESQYGLEYVTLDQLLEISDFVSLHVPLTPDTRQLIGEPQLRAMKASAILINLSRGPVVDTEALCTALKDGWIAGAGLDVMDPEPLPAGHPLLALDNVTLTPHIGSASSMSRRAMCIMAAQNLLAGLKGEQLVHCANADGFPSQNG